MNVTHLLSPETCEGWSSIFQWVAIGWVVVSELLPMVSDDTIQANGVLHGIQLCLQSDRVRKLFLPCSEGACTSNAEQTNNKNQTTRNHHKRSRKHHVPPVYPGLGGVYIGGG